MRTGLVSIFCLMALLLTFPAFGQDKKAPVPPTVSEVDALKLDKIVLADENLQMRIKQLQDALDKMREQAQTYVKTLDKPGYELRRNDKTGAWEYVAVPEPDKKK